FVPGQPVFSAPHDDQVIGGNDDCELSATAGRTVSVLRKIAEIIGNQPELPAIEAALTAGRGCRSARKSDPALGHDAVAVPGASIQIQQAESRKVAGVCVYLTAQDVIAESIHAWYGVTHSNPVEQHAAGKLLVLLIFTDRGFECVYTKQRVVVL